MCVCVCVCACVCVCVCVHAHIRMCKVMHVYNFKVCQMDVKIYLNKFLKYVVYF